ncbi:MAG: DUF192 domain-containing protein [Planctomycetes bacterium]|nr:DUF192 domain-containing protein [Planctomycetota bacterium]
MTQLFNETRNRPAVPALEVADTFATRFAGLLGRKELPRGAGLLLTKCNSVHMFFMRFAIDVAFLDNEMHVIKVVAGLKPWRLASCSKARHALELPAGEAELRGIEIGDHLKIIQNVTAAEPV